MKTTRTSAEFQPNRVLSYFKAEWRALLIVTVSGLIYNIGLLAGPWFEGTMTGYLVEILNGTGQFSGMLMLVISFAVVTAVVQISRYVKLLRTPLCKQCESPHERIFVWQPCEKKPCKPARRRRRQYHDEGHS